MEFSSKWIRWIKWCITTTRFSNLVNETSSCYFQSSKGLWQGDPSFPIPFYLVVSKVLRVWDKVTLFSHTFLSWLWRVSSIFWIRQENGASSWVSKVVEEKLWEWRLLVYFGVSFFSIYTLWSYLSKKGIYTNIGLKLLY